MRSHSLSQMRAARWRTHSFDERVPYAPIVRRQDSKNGLGRTAANSGDYPLGFGKSGCSSSLPAARNLAGKSRGIIRNTWILLRKLLSSSPLTGTISPFFFNLMNLFH